VKLLMAHDGAFSVTMQSFDTQTPTTLVRVRLALMPVDSQNPFLYHKTTHRRAYDDARAAVDDCDDVILWNESGEITESTIANVVVEIGGELFTPPVECGLLGGVFRAQLLKERRIKERVIRVEELKNSREIFLVNSLRFWRSAKLLHE
jgi:branched-subunit amino acid aminotransferase/4-amino-4-deoxychorismate lyase